MKVEELKIDSEFKALIPPMTDDERFQLTTNIVKDGCREPLVIWAGHGILLDGHNRYEICQLHGLKFQTVEMDFVDRDAALVWIINNQFGRRNLNPMQRAELALKLKPLLAKQAKDNQRLSCGHGVKGSQNSGNLNGSIDTDRALAKVSGVSHDTISRVNRIVAKGVPELAEAARKGEVSINTASVVATLPKEDQAKIVAQGADAMRDAAKITEHADRTGTNASEQIIIRSISIGPKTFSQLQSTAKEIHAMCNKPWTQISPLELRKSASDLIALLAKVEARN